MSPSWIEFQPSGAVAYLFSRQNTRTLSARKDLLVEPILAALFRRKTLRRRLTISGKNHEAAAVAAAGSNDVPWTSTPLITVRMARLADPILILVLRNRTFRNAIRSIAGISTLAAIVVSLQKKSKMHTSSNKYSRTLL